MHAATFIRDRRTILDRALLNDRHELTRILVHELFHYVWARLGNTERASFEKVLLSERRARARGELGWSSQIRRDRLRSTAGRPWREYVCEAFCDTAAWVCSSVAEHDEFTLAPRFCRARAAWFAAFLRQPKLRV